MTNFCLTIFLVQRILRAENINTNLAGTFYVTERLQVLFQVVEPGSVRPNQAEN